MPSFTFSPLRSERRICPHSSSSISRSYWSETLFSLSLSSSWPSRWSGRLPLRLPWVMQARPSLLQRVNESKYSALGPTNQTVTLGQTIGFKWLSKNELQREKIFNIRHVQWVIRTICLKQSQNLVSYLFKIRFRTVVHMRPNTTYNVSFLLCLKVLVDWKGLGDDKDDKSEVSDKARGEEVGF